MAHVSDIPKDIPADPNEMLTGFSLYRHPKTNSLYFVIGVGICSTNGERENKERSVFYWSFGRRQLRYREISEFLDGRFEREERV